MLEQLKDMSAAMSGMPKARQAEVAAHFQDPVALKVAWAPLRRQAGTVADVALHRVGEQRLELRSAGMGNGMMKVSLFALPVAGLALTMAAVGGGGVAYWAAAALCWLGFAAAVAQVRKRTVWDKGVGYFWSGPGEGPKDAKAAAQVKGAIPLGELYAVQLIPTLQFGEDEDGTDFQDAYTGYELNVVRRDGQRVGLTHHTGGAQLRREAAEIAAFLGVPLWDAGEVPRKGRGG